MVVWVFQVGLIPSFDTDGGWLTNPHRETRIVRQTSKDEDDEFPAVTDFTASKAAVIKPEVNK